MFCDESLASVKYKNKYGFVDDKGNTIIPFKYDYAYTLGENEGMYVELNRKKFYLNAKGECVKDCP